MKPVTIQNEFFTVQPVLNNTSDEEIDNIMNDVFALFSDRQVTASYPEKRINSLGQAQNWFFNTMMGYQLKTSFNHFLSLRETGETIGIIEVTTYKALEQMPSRAGLFTHYPELKGCIEIEYWLKKEHWNQGIMSAVVGAFSKIALSQDVPAITAFVSADNLASKSVLTKSGFFKAGEIPNKNGVADYHYIKAR